MQQCTLKRIKTIHYSKMHLLFYCFVFMMGSDAARILAVFPTPSYSHQTVFKVYVQALAQRGHDVVVIKPKTMVDFASVHARYNLTEIDVSVKSLDDLKKQSNIFRKRGVVADSTTVTATNYMNLVRMLRMQFNLPTVKNFINFYRRNGIKFDLLICEAFIDYSLIFSHIFGNLPIVQISSGYGLAENFETMGAVSRHPIFYPNMWRDKFRDLTVLETINEISTEIQLQREFTKLADDQNTLLRLQFGNDAPTIKELRNRVQLLLVNVHAIFDNNRPVPSSVQYLGAIHLDTITNNKSLDEFLKKYLDDAKEGVIYVSFGSSIETKDMDLELQTMLIQAFGNVTYKILWKFDADKQSSHVYSTQ
ncbi:EGT [Adoxophyes orana nucleopolyhedrovirus]|uniref:EGT n=1 Tax=Adoxophyes orana nucleopolyhedrovirus TaxID=542343 RepID=UPI0001829C45|nr:EGT [Adoxophyes orana nucleopolyhedrovirus]ACF05410.1 EGT [Adoxophyes orana nucleopolyhedrovirus]